MSVCECFTHVSPMMFYHGKTESARTSRGDFASQPQHSANNLFAKSTSCKISAPHRGWGKSVKKRYLGGAWAKAANLQIGLEQAGSTSFAQNLKNASHEQQRDASSIESLTSLARELPTSPNTSCELAHISCCNTRVGLSFKRIGIRCMVAGLYPGGNP